MDYLYYILAILVVGLVSISAVRIATRSSNPDLVLQYEARKRAARKPSKKLAKKLAEDSVESVMPAVKSLRERHREKMHYRTPWGWPGARQESTLAEHGISDTVKHFTDRLVREKQLVQPGTITNAGSIRALLEDRHHPVNHGIKEIPYQKVKRPLLRDPSDPHDQMDNLGKLETARMRRKLQFLSTMTNDEPTAENIKAKKKIEFRYVELKDLKQPWGW